MNTTGIIVIILTVITTICVVVTEYKYRKWIKQKLIRCKDCKFGYSLDGIYIHCTKPYSRENHTKDWYCADAKLKEGK